MRQSYPHSQRPVNPGSRPAAARQHMPAYVPGRRLPAYPPVRQARGRSTWVVPVLAAVMIALILLPVFLFGGTYAVYMLSGRILPGVTAGGIPAGDMTKAELAQAVNARWNASKNLALVYGEDTWFVAPGEVGLWIDPQATAEKAFQIGRGENAVQEFLWAIRFQQLSVNPVVIFSAQEALSGLERIAAQVNRPPQNAALRFENGRWITVPGVNGSSLNIKATLQQLAAAPEATLRRGVLPLIMQPVAPRVNDLTPVLDQLHQMLDRPMKMRAYDPITDETIDWTVPRETLAGWITVTPHGDEIALGLDSQRLASYLEEWKASLGPEKTLEPFHLPDDLESYWQNGLPVEVTIRHNPTTYVIESGDTLTKIAFKVGMPYWKIQQANPGLNPDRLYAGQTLTIPSKNEMLPLPVVRGKRIVISISEQHMWTYENGALRSEHVISTGIDRSPTIRGIYQVQTHELEAYASVWDLYMPHFIGIYEGWPGFMNGIHGLPTLSNGSRLWKGNLGRPVSYGCIILDLDEMEDLYYWADEGVVVEIRP
ncbi:MAG: LysM peptidoglycan-binding domain-containing protein [Chloroflexi bacterium]|nr:LysM peptidoglycan-binding domain-containing protein [Chloroflexota bacterium]